MNSDKMWVFGYGSLIWEPGFPYSKRCIATLSGWQRSFCMWSIHHRGTPERPGLVLALDEARGYGCTGVGFCVADGQEQATLDYLRERELVSSAYLERTLDIVLEDGRQVQAVTYVVDRAHEQYCGGLSAERQRETIAGATGGRGPNTEYLFNTVDHLSQLGISDPGLEDLARSLRTTT